MFISGTTPYTVKEVDTAIRYVIPEAQTAAIEWEKVTSRTFVNILKKFNVIVTKFDVETGTSQGDASLAGVTYVITMTVNSPPSIISAVISELSVKSVQARAICLTVQPTRLLQKTSSTP